MTIAIRLSVPTKWWTRFFLNVDASQKLALDIQLLSLGLSDKNERLVVGKLGSYTLNTCKLSLRNSIAWLSAKTGSA